MIGDTTLDRYQQQQLQGAIVLPPEMQAALAANPHLLLPLRNAIRKSVEVSFAHHQTKMMVITGDEITRRAQLCLEILQIAHAEQGFHLLQMIDALPGILVDVLLKDTDGNRLLAEDHQQGKWATGGGDSETEALCEIDGVLDHRMVADDPDDDDDTLDEDEDLTEGVKAEPFSDTEYDQYKEAQDA